jgi:hypothetical protein
MVTIVNFDNKASEMQNPNKKYCFKEGKGVLRSKKVTSKEREIKNADRGSFEK